MNLVHVRIRLDGPLDDHEWLRQAFHSRALLGEGVEHISVHLDDDGELTVGFWLSAASAVAGEDTAHSVARRALSSEPTLHRASIVSCSTALVPEAFDRILRSPSDSGRSRQRTDTATPDA
ncbi:hypothetical protein B9W68_02010 [Streptomyces sp. CS227]|uniref:hypothetical protein n=1 Tax=Streptomyces sp. CS227 TaxID=1982763 RepID=UPI000B419F5C|nr:hypothetical protein [Streptomyces sp. CS227]OWA19286.1 hypothetical protein B9W68_02010 [Streptomyces sp. CS227]